MYFLTYNDAPDGIYMSQVIDVCRFWEDTFHEKVKLIAFVSLRNFSAHRLQLKQAWKNSLILPMFPGINNWKANRHILAMAMMSHEKGNVIARGVFATLLALGCKKFIQVCFDARGAYAAEWEEYLKSYSPALAADMPRLEKEALLRSHSRIAVSTKLVKYWKDTYGYNQSEHSVIPCTLSSNVMIGYDSSKAGAIRQELNIVQDDILLVYSGSSAGWQSFNILSENINSAFSENVNIKLLMLCKPGDEKDISKLFPGRVIQKWVQPSKVQDYLQAADYGLLIREYSITNRVSSPVKFAEYLVAGLPVIISEHIGDYSTFVLEKNCGMVVGVQHIAPLLKRLLAEEKKRIQQIAEKYFIKTAYTEQYRNLFY